MVSCFPQLPSLPLWPRLLTQPLCRSCFLCWLGAGMQEELEEAVRSGRSLSVLQFPASRNSKDLVSSETKQEAPILRARVMVGCLYTHDIVS